MSSENIISKIKYSFNENITYKFYDSEAHDLYNKKSEAFQLGNCKNILCLKSGTTVKINWEDPGDLKTSDGAVLTKQKRTTLVRKQNSIPSSITDGTIITVSNVVNQYKVSPFIDTLPNESKTYYYKLFPQSVQYIITNNNQNAFSYNEINWETIHNLTEAGTISSYFELGDILTTKHQVYGDIEWQIVDFDHPWTFADGKEHHSLTLLSRYVLASGAFDATEKQYAVTEDQMFRSFEYLKYNDESYLSTLSAQYFILDDKTKLTSDRVWTSVDGLYKLYYNQNKWVIKDIINDTIYNYQKNNTSPDLNPYNNSTQWNISASLISWKKYYTYENYTYTEFTNFNDLDPILSTYYEKIPDACFKNSQSSRAKYGYNCWSQSGIRQWLNSYKSRKYLLYFSKYF